MSKIGWVGIQQIIFLLLFLLFSLLPFILSPSLLHYIFFFQSCFSLSIPFFLICLSFLDLFLNFLHISSFVFQRSVCQNILFFFVLFLYIIPYFYFISYLVLAFLSLLLLLFYISALLYFYMIKRIKLSNNR